MADDLRRVGLVFKEDGAVDFKKSLQEVNLELNKNYNQFKLNQAQWDESTTKAQKLKEQQDYLTEAYELQRDKVETLRMQLTDLENAENKNISSIKKKRNELVNAELKLKSYGDKLEKTTINLRNVEDSVETTADKIKRLNHELKENENRFKLTQSQYTAMTSKTQKLKDEEKYLTQTYILQEEKISLLKSELDELESVEDKNTNAIYRKRQELIKAETELNSYNARLQIVTNQLNSFSAKAIETGEKIEKAGNRIEGAGKKLSAFSVATASAFVASAKSAIDFEDAFTGVEKTVDETANTSFADLRQGIRDLAKEIPSTTTEISAVAEAAGQLGISADDVLSFTKVMIDLGNSTNLSAEEAASSLAKFANITNMSAKDYDKLGSTIVALGNNFATTEADIVAMSTRLAATGELAGLSQSQILSLATAMSSVGIEAEAGGSAMSKLLKKIQVAVETGSEDLKDYAKVAGMTSKEFKKAFEKDAVGALTAFISGLNDTERNGKSAITILEDMGLKETRLSNTILSLANASGVMTDAVRLGSNAWEDNDALTNEANKRYGTLKSQIQIAINKLKDLTITIGNKLTPVIPKVTKQIEKFTKWVEKLDDKQVEWILNVGKAVIAIGPLITILGKITKTGGTAIKTIGTFTQAIGVAKGTITSTSTAVNGLAKVISLINPMTAVAVVGLTALAGATVYLEKKHYDAIKVSKDFAQSMKEEKDSFDERNKAIDEAAQANIAHIENVKKLKDELKNLVDENGKVKEGYESRVDFILKQLNDALGTEYERNEDVIKSYQEIQNEIDNLISKKKAEIKLNAEEEKYKNAIEEEQKAVEELKFAHDNLGMSYGDAKKKMQEYINAWTDFDAKKLDEINMTDADFQNLKNWTTAYEEAEGKIKTSLENQKQYEQDYALFTEGKFQEIGNVVKSTTQNWSDTTSETLKKSIEEQTNNLNAYKEIHARTGDEIALKNQQQAEENLKKLADELYARTSTVEEMGEDEKKAWEQLATQAYNVYDEKIKNIPSDMRQKIEDTTKVISSDTQLVGAAEKISQNVQSTFENNTNGEGAGKNFVSGVKAGLANKSEVDGAVSASGSLGSRILNKFKDVLGIHSPSKEAEEAMEYYIEGIVLGITSNQKGALKTVGDFAESLNNRFNNELDANKQFNVSTNYGSSNNFTEAIYDTNKKIIDLLTRILAKNPQIVMDSGTLVGEIIDPIDQEMGNRQSRRERGT